jgi:hypothetical protein
MLRFLKSYFLKMSVVAVVGGIVTDYSDEKFHVLMEGMALIAKHVAEKLNFH